VNTGSDVSLALDDNTGQLKTKLKQVKKRNSICLLFSQDLRLPAPSTVTSAPPVCPNEVTVAEAALNDKLSDIHADLSPALKLLADKH
jgi:hypothetical protein